MYKDLYCVRYEIEDRSDELLFLSDSYKDAEKFYHKKVNELKNNKDLKFGFVTKDIYCGDFANRTTFFDNDFISCSVIFSNYMWYGNGLLYHGDGTTEEMTEEELFKTLESYHID